VAINRTFTVEKTVKRSELLAYGYIDDGASGGQIVIPGERTKPGVAPTQSGIIEAMGADYLIVSLTNNSGTDIIWVAQPKIRGTNNPNLIAPQYADGYALPSEATQGVFSSTLSAGDEDAVKVDTNLTGYGIILRANAPAQNLDITVRVLRKVS